jgi:hypothetical protein
MQLPGNEIQWQNPVAKYQQARCFDHSKDKKNEPFGARRGWAAFACWICRRGVCG